jgi:hypothetical protein
MGTFLSSFWFWMSIIAPNLDRNGFRPQGEHFGRNRCII